MDWSNPPPGFSFALFDRVDPVKNEDRFYYISYQATLFEPAAVLVIYGRKGVNQRLLVTPFASLEDAWPKIRQAIRRRLNHGYRVVEPLEYR